MKKYLLKIIGILIFVYILFKMDISEIIKVLVKTRMDYVFIVLVFAMPVVLIKSWRWQYLLKMQDIDYSLKNAFITYWSSIYIGTITPGRIGEFARVFYLKEDKRINIGKAFSSVFSDRLLDLLVLIIFSFIGIFYFSLTLDIFSLAVLSLISILAISISISMVFVNKRIRDKLLHFIKLLPYFGKYKREIEIHYNDFFESLSSFKNIKMLIPVGASFVAYSIFYYQCYLMALSLEINISLFSVICCISIANIISLIPITISGIGTRDATLIFLFSFLGLNKELAVSYSIILLAFVYISTAIFGGIMWWKKPLKIGMILESSLSPVERKNQGI